MGGWTESRWGKRAHTLDFSFTLNTLQSTVGEPILSLQHVSNLQLLLCWVCQHLITEALLRVCVVLKEAPASPIRPCHLLMCRTDTQRDTPKQMRWMKDFRVKTRPLRHFEERQSKSRPLAGEQTGFDQRLMRGADTKGMAGYHRDRKEGQKHMVFWGFAETEIKPRS